MQIVRAMERYKWTTISALYLGYLLTVLNRKSFSFTIPTLTLDLALSKEELGLISSSQNLAYGISKFIGGIVTDLVAPKRLFVASLLLSGLITSSMAVSDTVQMFAVLSFLQGLVQGGSWPSAAKILQQWSRPTEFAMLWSVLSTSMNVACSVGPLLTAVLLSYYQWPFCFLLFGCLAALMSVSGSLFITNSPEDVELISATTERKKTDKVVVNVKGRGRGRWPDMLKSPLLWLLGVSYLVVFLGRTAALDWGQLYLIQEAGQSTLTGSLFISSLEVGGIVGSVAAGYLADKLVMKSERTTVQGSPRLTVATSFLLLFIISLWAMIGTVNQHSSQLWILVISFGMGFGVYGAISLYGVMANEAAPTHLQGTSGAIVSLFSNVGAVLAGLPFSFVAHHLNWRGAFMMLQLLLIAVFLLKVAYRNVDYKMVATRKKMD